MTQNTPQEGHDSFYEFDPLTGWRGRANLHAVHEGPDGPSQVRHNAIGNRDGDHRLQPAGPRIALLGGSLTWGYGVSEGERYADFLADSLPGVDIMNFAHCNFGLDQSFLALRHLALPYKPGIVVLEQHPWVLFRLMLRSLKDYPKPYFGLSKSNSLELHGVPALARFKLMRKVSNAYRSYSKEVFDEFAGIDLSRDYDPAADPMFSHIKQDAYDYLYDIARQLFAAIADFCARHDMRLLVVVTSIAQQFRYVPPCRLIDYDIPRQRLRSILTRQSIPFVDVSPMHLAAHSAATPVILSDGHWNGHGHRIVADQIAEKIRERGWL